MKEKKPLQSKVISPEYETIQIENDSLRDATSATKERNQEEMIDVSWWCTFKRQLIIVFILFMQSLGIPTYATVTVKEGKKSLQSKLVATLQVEDGSSQDSATEQRKQEEMMDVS